ncbi:hypothetical protein Vadar_015849 [Vaccinium darrowii]|uniref:Uncharacterized protein n=1 Tax=Vaccinium darrowii TaxID=229202 RepID=A0ACB7XHR2_9ERIC|nr:hypothetical protein Vadar_015849 [Vaccinium darrowii]
MFQYSSVSTPCLNFIKLSSTAAILHRHHALPLVADCHLLSDLPSLKSPSSPSPSLTAVQCCRSLLSCCCSMVNAIKGLLISCDIPMAQFIINLDNSLPPSQKFIIHTLDSTHLFVQPHVSEMIRSAIAEFRDQNSYEKPA